MTERSSAVEAVVFDIGGTLLDSTGSTITGFRKLLSHLWDDAASAESGQDLETRVDRRTKRISRGDEPFLFETDLKREVLIEILTERETRIDDEVFEELVHLGARFEPFPGVPEQLDRVARHVPVVGLTNAALDQFMWASARSGMRWSALLGSQLAQTYKPDPAAYALVPDLLAIDPRRALFVASHPWDLRGAAAAGFRTVYIPRPHTDNPEPGDRFDHRIASLDELVGLVTS